MLINELTSYLESIAPLALQENYDNAGLLTGNLQTEISSVLISLDCTEAVVEEAIQKKCNIIISHHPIIFSGLKKITGSNMVERTVIKAIQNNIALYAIHTNLDNIANGVSYAIAEKLGLVNIKVLSPKKQLLRKLVTFCPVAAEENVRTALFQAGAGHIGNYDECSFGTQGSGSFRATENANPYVGEIGKRHNENEIRIETIFPSYMENKIIKALVKSHPYEEVAYDIYLLENEWKTVGSGVIGDLQNEMTEMEFFKEMKNKFTLPMIKHTEVLGKAVKKVAICGGSGIFTLKSAIREGANLLITADVKYHEFFNAENKIVIADIGHYESELCSKELIFGFIQKKFTNLAISYSNINTNPVFYFL